MKSTNIKVSVSQDGLLPEESVDLVMLEFPVLQKKLLRALGFERVDSSTFVGVLPVFVNLRDKEQEIDIELGVSLPEMRKKVLEILQTPLKAITPPPVQKANKKGKSSQAKTTKKSKTSTSKTKKAPSRKSKR